MSQPYEYLWSNYAHSMFGHVNWGHPKIFFGMTGKTKQIPDTINESNLFFITFHSCFTW